MKKFSSRTDTIFPVPSLFHPLLYIIYIIGLKKYIKCRLVCYLYVHILPKCPTIFPATDNLLYYLENYSKIILKLQLRFICLLRKVDRVMNHLIGCRLKNDIFTESGYFLLSSYTLLRKEHIDKLEHYNISITSEDVILPSASFDKDDQIIKDALSEIKQMFQIVNYSKKVPLKDIYMDVLPSISYFSDKNSIFKLINELQNKDDYTYSHNLAVAVLASTLARWIRLNERETQALTIAALLHDIGKSKIPEDILHKTGRLSKEESEEVRKHTLFGYEIITNTVGASKRMALVALQHHERLDGNGYPYGLKGEQIDFFSQIVAICDIFHASTSEKFNQEPKPFFVVLKEMQENSYGKLNTKVVNIFTHKLMESTIGNDVILSNGEFGKVIMLNPFESLYPIIEMKSDGLILDLSRERKLYIEKVMENREKNLKELV